MNRLQGQTFAWPQSESTAGACSSGIFHAASDKDYPHAHFAPLHYEQNYGLSAPSLVAWRWRYRKTTAPHHAVGEHAELCCRRPARTIEVPHRSGTGRGFQWAQTFDHAAQAEEAIRAAIASTQRRFNIRHDRIFLAGYESGGTMAFRIAVENPDQYAGVLSLCGPFPTEGAPLAKLHTVRRLPLFVAACRNGSYYPTQQVCNNLRLFHSAGMSITLREYPGEDGLSQRMLSDVDRWIMEQIVGPPTTAVVPPHQSGVN